MKKRFLGVVLSAVVLSVSALTCFAAESESKVTLNKDSVLEYADSDVNVNVAPGESFVETIVIKNEYELTSDFYLSTSVVSDLEKSVADGKAKGAGYDVKLEVKNGDAVTTLYDSTVGGEGTTSGLSTVDLQDTMLIATLPTGKTASVVLTINFDGEGLDNTVTADYANAAANLNFDFKAGYEAPTGETTEVKVVEQKGETQYITVEGEAALTGDSVVLPIVIAIAFAAGIVLLIVGRKKSSKVASTVMAGIAALLILGLSTTANAADKTYTVTFRPGSVGSFVTTADELMEAYNAGSNGACVAAETTANGAIKLTIVANSAMPSFPNVEANEGYVENTAWKTGADAIVTKDVDFVADYAKLVNGVEYTIVYVDAETGDSVYQPYTTLGNVGDKITATLPTSIVISDAAYYYPVSGQKATLTLDADKTKNVLTIKYEMQPRNAVEEVRVVYVNGDIITTVVPATAPAAAVTPAGGGAAAVTPEVEIEEEETPLAPGTEETGDVVIEEEETPLAPSIPEETPSAEVEIEEEETPLAGGFEESSNWPFVAGAVAVLAIVAAFLFVALRKKSAVVSETENTEEK